MRLAQKAGVWKRWVVPAFVTAYVVTFFLVQAPKIFDYYRVSDDIRQQIYPLHRVRDPQLFKNDLLTQYFRSHTPPAYYYFHYPFAFLIDPVVLSKIAQIGLLAVVLVFLYLIGKCLEDSALGSICVLLFVHSPALSGLTDGGLPRACAVVGVTIFVWGALANRPVWALAATTLSALFYPPIFLVLGPSYVIWALYTRNLRVSWCVGASVVIFVGLYPMVFRAPEIGTTISYAQASTMPEWQATGGRFPFIPIPSLLSLAPAKFVSAIAPATSPHPVIWALTALALYSLASPFLKGQWSAVSRRLSGVRGQESRVRGQGSVARRRSVVSCQLSIVSGILLVVSLVMYEVSSWVAFRMHIPDRTIIYSLPVLGMILLARVPGIARIAGVAAAFVLWGSGFEANLNLWADQQHAAKLYDFVGTLPKEALLAGPPTEMDNIPLFSKRTVYVSDEAAQPLYDRFYEEISRRLKRFYRAYYATDAADLRAFAKETGVRYMLVKSEDFTHEFRRERYYYEPYDSYIKSLITGKNASECVLSNPPARSIVYNDGYYVVVDLSELLANESHE